MSGFQVTFQLFVFIAFSVACSNQMPRGEENLKKPGIYMDADLEPLLWLYVADAEKADVPVPFEFRMQLVRVEWSNDLGQQGDETILGRCDRMNENHPDENQRFRTVKIRRPDADGFVGSVKVDALTLKTIVYHELGHCLHDFRGHLPEAAHQIMSTALPSERFQSFHELLHKHFALLKSGQ